MKNQAFFLIGALLAALSLGLLGCSEDPNYLPDDFKIRDQFIPKARLGESYERGIEARGGWEPYMEWQVAAGELPEGVALEPSSGVLHGTPDGAEGVYPFVVQAADSDREPSVDTAALALQVIAPGSSGPLYRRARELNSGYWTDHAPSGLALSTTEQGGYADYDRAGFLTGLYLAAAAWQRQELQEDPEQDQEPAVLALSSTLEAVHRLLEITGEPGLLAGGFERDAVQLLCCDDLADPDCDEQHLCGEGVPEGHAGQGDYAGWHWLGDAGRDTYAAVLFGLVAAYDATLDSTARQRMADDAAAMLDRLWEDDLRIVDADGEVTSLGNVSGIDPDEDSRRALAALAWHKAAYYLTGEQRFEQRYRELLEQRDYLRIVTGPNDIYTAYDTDFREALLTALNLHLLLKLEQDDELRQIYYNTFNHSLWSSETGFRRGDQDRDALLALLVVQDLGYWPDYPLYAAWNQLVRYPAAPLLNRAVDLSDDPDVAQDPQRAGWAAEALWLGQRPPAVFAWLENPYLLQRGADDGRQFSGADYLLCYWLGRISGMLPAEW